MISLTVAASQNNVIGKNGALPWHLPLDLKHFKEVTMGHPVIMGRKTYESIMTSLGNPLPGRTNIVVTRNAERICPGCTVFHSLEDAIEKAKKEDPEEVCVIGGADIYRQTLPLADIIYFTRVYTEIEGDAFFPEIDEQEWEKVSEERHENDDEHEYPFSFETYKRRK